MNVGDRIKKRRKEIRMSVDELADAVGKSRATIYRYENGDIEKLPVDVLLPFASALKTSPDYLMGWTGEESEHVQLIEALVKCAEKLSHEDIIAEIARMEWIAKSYEGRE